jgi:large subunit ribosomal protein L4
MAKVDLLDRGGKKVGDRDLPADLFEARVNVPLMHQVVVAGLAALRAGTHSTKTRAEVRGGGRKPWRQKGTGRARQGSTRAPQWTGGGVAHGPKPRSYEQRTNKKMKRAALLSALTDTLASGKLALIDHFEFDVPRTKDAIEVIQSFDLTGKILLVLHEPTEIVEKSFNNLPYVKISYARSLNVYELLAADRVLFTAAALDVLEGKDPAVSTGKADGKGSSDDDHAEDGEGE